MKRYAPFAAILVCALILFAPALARNEVFTFRDHSDYFQPLRFFTAIELRQGHLPLWNPYNASGEPWLANPQTGIFYPPAWLFAALPFTIAYTAYLLLHLVLLGCGAYLLFARLLRSEEGASTRRAGLRPAEFRPASRGAARRSPALRTSSASGRLHSTERASALAAAIALTFCGPVMSLLDVQNNLTTFAWLPLVLWCALSGASARVSAAVIALSFLAGEPFYATTAAVLFAITRRRGARDLINVALTSLALTAIQLFPFLEMVAASDRAHGGVPRGQLLRDSMPPRDWLRVALPPNLGGTAFDPRLGQHFLPIIYIGALTCLFGLIGVAVARRGAVPWIALAVVCGLIAAGGYFAPIGELLVRMPLTLFRYPARLVPIVALSICALAAFGLQRTIRSPRWTIVIGALMFVDVALQVQPLLVTARFREHPVPYARTIGRDAKLMRLAMPITRVFDRNAWIAGYLNLYDRRFDAWTAAPIASQRYTELYEAATATHQLSALNRLSAGYVLAPRPLPEFTPVAIANGVVAQRNRAAFPLAYFCSAATRAISGVSALAFDGNHVYVQVDAPADGEVIVTQQDAPGWRAQIDGRPANPRKSAIFRKLTVSRGHHEIVWSYRPLSLIAGAVVTLAGLVRLLFPPGFVKRSEDENFLRARPNSEV